LSNDGKLKGCYLLTVNNPDRTVTRNIPAATDWVETNFKKEVLAAAQKAFFDALKKLEVKSLDGDRKKKSSQQGFVNVENENLTIKIEKDTINMIRYIKPRKSILVTHMKQKKLPSHLE